MRNGKLFAKIVYYIFTFTIGILLALFLPYIFGSDYGEILNSMESSLKKGNYSSAMQLVGGYFDSREVFQQNFEGGGGIVIFCAATLVNAEGEETAGETKIHEAYAGFVYGAENYAVTSATDNRTRLVAEDGAGKEHVVEILNVDSDGDGKKDTINTLRSNRFFYFDFGSDTFPSLRKLTFYDKDGRVFQTVTLDLNYDQPFFADVRDFVEEYNRDWKSEQLDRLHEAFLAKSENYKISTTGVVANSKADTKAAIVVVAYFVCVYVNADFLLGHRFILRFFRWFLFKVCKIKPKQKKTPKRSEVFGNDYYCQVTFELDVTEVDDFAESVQIRYTDAKGEEISFILIKQENYQTTQRVKAGVYVNLWIDLNKTEYATQDLPEELPVEGYRKTFTVKILRRTRGGASEEKTAVNEALPEANGEAKA